MYKITITQLDSRGKERIIDCQIVETRDKAERFIKQCKALPKEYEPKLKAPTCFYAMEYIYNGIRQN
jgi:hypothetical protein